ncbi:hypothetical protein ERJ75_000493600 [Trypanosoma vivax]|nr:hypothetical protein ERJ75_000493600 [Trypanosoma vivax]
MRSRFWPLCASLSSLSVPVFSVLSSRSSGPPVRRAAFACGQPCDAVCFCHSLSVRLVADKCLFVAFPSRQKRGRRAKGLCLVAKGESTPRSATYNVVGLLLPAVLTRAVDPPTFPHQCFRPRGAAWLAAGPLSTAVALSSVGAHAAKDARTLQHRTAALLTRAPPRRACRAVAWQHVLPPPLHDKPLAPSTPLATIRGVPLASAAKSFRQRTLAARRPVCPRETPAAPRHARGSLGYASRRRSPRPNARARRGGERAAASKAERACEGGWCASHERRTASSARDAWATAAAVTGQSAFHVDCPECSRVGARQLTPASTRRTQEATELRPHVGARAAPQQRGLAGG